MAQIPERRRVWPRWMAAARPIPDVVFEYRYLLALLVFDELEIFGLQTFDGLAGAVLYFDIDDDEVGGGAKGDGLLWKRDGSQEQYGGEAWARH